MYTCILYFTNWWHHMHFLRKVTSNLQVKWIIGTSVFTKWQRQTWLFVYEDVFPISGKLVSKDSHKVLKIYDFHYSIHSFKSSVMTIEDDYMLYCSLINILQMYFICDWVRAIIQEKQSNRITWLKVAAKFKRR